MKQTSIKQQLDTRFRRVQLIAFVLLVGIAIVVYVFFKFTAHHPIDTHLPSETNEQVFHPLSNGRVMIAIHFHCKYKKRMPHCKVSSTKDEMTIHIEGNNQLITDFINGNEKLTEMTMEAQRCDIKFQKAQNTLDARFAIERRKGIAYVSVPNDIIFKLTDKLIALP